MGMGPNYVLDKGCLATGSTAYALGQICKVIQNPLAAQLGVSNAVIQETSATSQGLWVVCQEALDTTRLGFGKAILDMRILGISRVLAGAAISVSSGPVRVTCDATSRAVTLTRAAAGAQPAPCLGFALTGATAAGQYIDVLLTPGASY